MPVNLASRLQAIAGPGEILISRSTREALNGSIPVQELDSMPIKGFDEPVQVFRVVQGIMD
jgi:class 3 adenylate cyclase